MIPRAPEPGETEPLARLWHAAWHRAHAGLVPSELVASRTVEDFRARLGKLLADTRVAGPADAPVGLCVVRGAELYPLYVAERAYGTGLGARLLADGEDRIAAAGHRLAYLDCVAENARAVRFYTRQGWTALGLGPSLVDTASGTFTLTTLRFEKRLGP